VTLLSTSLLRNFRYGVASRVVWNVNYKRCLVWTVVYIYVNWLRQQWIWNDFWCCLEKRLLHFCSSTHGAWRHTISSDLGWLGNNIIRFFSLRSFSCHINLRVKFTFVIWSSFEINKVSRCKIHIWNIPVWSWWLAKLRLVCIKLLWHNLSTFWLLNWRQYLFVNNMLPS